MANKKLDALLDERANDEKPIIQRGGGMRLSNSQAPTANDFEQDTSNASEITTSLSSDKVKQTGKKADSTEPERKASGYKLRVDLTRRLKVYALNQDMTLQEALEAAIEEYLGQHESGK